MGKEGSDRRRQPRFIVGKRARARGRVTSLYEASLLNISTSGALIEHSEVVSPGTVSFLELDLRGRKVSLKCRVAWSVVHRVEVYGGGERAAVYHTGLEFLKPSDETRRVISEYIRSVAEKGQGTDRRLTRRSYICDKCGEDCEVPFRPTQGKPIYCDDCFKDKSRDAGSRSEFGKPVNNENFDHINKKLDKILRILETKKSVEKKEKPKKEEENQPDIEEFKSVEKEQLKLKKPKKKKSKKKK